jgi:molybdopterin-guanine dinucleotide biosynthesis protein
VRIVVVGGSASNVGKTTLAVHLARMAARTESTVAMKVSVREKPCDTRVLIFRAAGEADHRKDSDRFLEVGVGAVIWVTVQRPYVRSGLAAGLREARRLKPRVLVIESTSAGIEMKSDVESFFVAGEGEWKPWAHVHRDRADRVLTSVEVMRLAELTPV